MTSQTEPSVTHILTVYYNSPVVLFFLTYCFYYNKGGQIINLLANCCACACACFGSLEL